MVRMVPLVGPGSIGTGVIPLLGTESFPYNASGHLSLITGNWPAMKPITSVYYSDRNKAMCCTWGSTIIGQDTGFTDSFLWYHHDNRWRCPSVCLGWLSYSTLVIVTPSPAVYLHFILISFLVILTWDYWNLVHANAIDSHRVYGVLYITASSCPAMGTWRPMYVVLQQTEWTLIWLPY